MTLNLDVILHNAGLDPTETQANRHTFVREHQGIGLPAFQADSTESARV